MNRIGAGLFILFIASIASAQVTYLPTFIDGRSAALGNAMVLGTNGSNAIFVNPANVPRVAVGMAQMGGRGFTGGEQSDVWEDYYDSKEVRFDFKPKMMNVSCLLPLQYMDHSVIIGGFGFGALYDRARIAENHEERMGHIRYTNTEEIGGINFMTFSLSLKTDSSVDAGISYHTTAESNYIYEREDYYTRKGFDNSLIDDLERQIYDYRGSYFTFGLTYRALENLTLGANYRTTFEYKVENYRYSILDGYGETVTDCPDFKENIPTSAGISVLYHLRKDLLVVGEYEFRDLSNHEYGFTERYSGWSDHQNELKDGHTFHFGVERSGPVSLRFGGFSEAILLKRKLNSADPARRSGVSAGLGLQKGSAAFDFFGQLSHYSSEDRLFEDIKFRYHTFGMSFTFMM